MGSGTIRQSPHWALKQIIMPKETISKERQEVLREKLEVIVEALQPLSAEERVRVLRTTAVFFNLERDVEFE
jgi:hypothetical protein